MRKSLLLLAIGVLAAGSASAQKYYNPDISGIIESYGCTGCHGFSGGLNLSTYSSLMAGGIHGAIVVPGDTNSNMVLKLKPNPPFGSRMPFGGPYLPDADIRTIVQWIQEGAKESASTGVEESTPQLPALFALRQNSPNPFNPTTVISFSLPSRLPARLALYDLLGREVATLIDEELSAGDHTVRFDAGEIASGIYLFRLEAGQFSAVRRMLLLR